jgi:hypothetical protein
MTKQNKGKKEWRHILDLWSEYEDLADIMDIVAKSGKYLRRNWQNVPKEDYQDALFRHLSAHLKGERVDKETGKLHISHVAWNCLVLAWHEKNVSQERIKKPTNLNSDLIKLARDNFSNVSKMEYPEFDGDDAA